MKATKNIAIIANTNLKTHLIEWSFHYRETLGQHNIIANGKAAAILSGTLNKEVTELAPRSVGGYGEISQLIRSGGLDVLMVLNTTKASEKRQKQLNQVLQDAMEANIVVAPNLATANIIIQSLEQEAASAQQNDQQNDQQNENPGFEALKAVR